MTELKCLAFNAFILMLGFLPNSIAKARAGGSKYVNSNRDKEPSNVAAWGERSWRAYLNNVYYFPAFMGIILSLQILGHSTEFTKNMAMTYVALRYAHFISYTFGIVHLRAIAWFGAMGALLALYFELFKL